MTEARAKATLEFASLRLAANNDRTFVKRAKKPSFFGKKELLQPGDALDVGTGTDDEQHEDHHAVHMKYIRHAKGFIRLQNHTALRANRLALCRRRVEALNESNFRPC